VDLKFDVEDLRREFEAYKQRHPELTYAREASAVDAPWARPGRAAVEEVEFATVEPESTAFPERDREDEDVIYFRPGMTMQDLERAAIVATLKAEGGNRRRASEQLGIGERTLYRKLREYNIEA
jgi:transcriptional regulator of acetoin/glycerol metabolism